jgi:hypothetical protein
MLVLSEFYRFSYFNENFIDNNWAIRYDNYCYVIYFLRKEYHYFQYFSLAGHEINPAQPKLVLFAALRSFLCIETGFSSIRNLNCVTMKGCLMLSELVPCLTIGTHRIYRNDESRILLVDSLMMKFTPIEYRLLLSLLRGQAVADSHLVREAFLCELDRSVQKNLDKHIDKIRNKLQPAGLGVHRVSKYGYVLLAVPV